MADKDAIHKDVSQEEATDLDTEITTEGADPSTDQLEEEVETEEPAAPPKSDREILMEELAKKRRDELKNGEGEQEDVEEEPDDPTVTPDDDEDEPDETPDSDPSKEMVELKVNGRIIHRTRQEVEDAGGVAAIQKRIAGDLKLEQAAEERKQLALREKQNEERLAQMAAENAQLKAALSGQQSNLSDAEIEKKADAIAEKFFMGDADELKTAIADLLKSNRSSQPTQSPINEDAIAAKVRKDIEFETERKKAQSYFNTSHSDLSENPHRRKYVNDVSKEIIHRKRQLGEPIVPMDIIEEAIVETRQRLGIPAPAAEKKDTVISQKLNRKKQSSDRIPVASQRVPAPAKRQQKTGTQIFEQMKKNRSHS